MHHAVAEHGLTLTAENADALMKSYDALRVFPEIPSALKLLDENSSSVEAYVFSNGTGEMVGNSIKTSPDLGPHAEMFKSLITVDEVQCFKPDRRSYDHLLGHIGRQGDTGNVWLVSANPFDIVGARAAGLNASFIDRSGKGWIDRLDEKRAPSVTASGVDEAIRLILKY